MLSGRVRFTVSQVGLGRFASEGVGRWGTGSGSKVWVRAVGLSNTSPNPEPNLVVNSLMEEHFGEETCTLDSRSYQRNHE